MIHNITNIIGELNDRIIMPLFIPSLVLLACFLIITNKEIINNNFLKLISFYLRNCNYNN